MNKWREHPFCFVIGCIDSNGAITAAASKANRTHRPEESRGKRWRWSIGSQEFTEAGTGGQEAFTDEELAAVMEWLERREFACV